MKFIRCDRCLCEVADADSVRLTARNIRCEPGSDTNLARFLDHDYDLCPTCFEGFEDSFVDKDRGKKVPRGESWGERK